MKHLFVLVPSLDPSGPVKGAVALANSLVGTRKVTLVHLKPGPGVDTPLDRKIDVASLAKLGTFRGKLAAYQKMLSAAGGRCKVASLSFCFSADMTNLFCRAQAVTLASVRGNLLQNYHLHYGLLGFPLAVTHLIAMRAYDHVVAMSAAMGAQIRRYSGREPTIIGNFVDEAPLEAYRQEQSLKGPLRFVFLGSLTRRKQPLMLLRALDELCRRRIDARLDIIGDGPTRKQLEIDIAKLRLTESITLHGHLSSPYELLAQADAFVLPSFSEGMPRSGLEAQHLGVPCVLRDVDGNAELIRDRYNGGLFKRDEELAFVMAEVAVWSRSRAGIRHSLLPANCRQSLAAGRYLALAESKA
jgi:glycosyltransferase involved in cell wall biosynthesis